MKQNIQHATKKKPISFQIDVNLKIQNYSAEMS